MSKIDEEVARKVNRYGVEMGIGGAGTPGRSTVTSRMPPSARSIARAVMSEMNGVAPGADVLVARAAEGSGHALPSDLRARFESSLGADLGGVRVHTDAAAADASAALDARAYATGHDVYMGSGQYAPETAEGAWLLAHEVAHTVQQRGAGGSPQMKLEVSEPGDAMETEADSAADAMVLGRPTSVSSASGTGRKLARYRRNVTAWGGQLIGSSYSYLDLIPAVETFLVGVNGAQSYAQIPPGGAAVHVRAGSHGHVRVRLHVAYNIAQFGRDDNGSAEFVAGWGYDCDAAGHITWNTEASGLSGDPLQSQIFSVTPSAAAGGNTMTARFQFTGPATTASLGIAPAGMGPGVSRAAPASAFTELYSIVVVVDGAQPETNGGGQGGGGTNNNTNTNSAQGGAGGAGGAGGNANVTINMPPAQQPQPPQGGGSAPAAPSISVADRTFTFEHEDDDRLDQGHPDGAITGELRDWVISALGDDALAQALRDGRAHFTIIGSTSTTGTVEYNERLSRRRAHFVSNVVMAQCLNRNIEGRDRIIYEDGVGEGGAYGGDHQARAQYRRVMIGVRPGPAHP